MNWTVSRRILAGFTIAAVISLAIAVAGLWAVRETSSGYDEALRTDRDVLLTAVQARGAVRNANIAYLRVLLENAEDYLPEFEAFSAEARRLHTFLQDTAATGQTRTWTEALMMFIEWEATVREVMTAWNNGDQDLAREIRRTRVTPLREQLEGIVDRNLDLARTGADEQIDIALQRASDSRSLIMLGLVGAIAVLLVTGYLLNRAVSAPLQETSNVLATTATQILSTTTEQASGATESLAAVTETAATVDQVVQTAEQSAERARGVAGAAQHAAEIGRDGRRAVEMSMGAMQGVQERVHDIGDRIRALSDQTQAIREIISTVNDIAEQTHLLALNAAIEAARAGEHGRGFAVEASEVKGLAEQSKTGTARVRHILEQIERATTDAVAAIEHGNRQVADASSQVSDAGETIRKLAESIASASQSAAQIAASAGQQSLGMGQIRQAIGNIQQAAQQNLAATRQAESAAQDLHRAGSRLLDLVGTRPQSAPGGRIRISG